MDPKRISELAKKSLRDQYSFTCNRVIGYVRVSSVKQSKYSEGHISLEAQKEYIRQFVLDKHITHEIEWVEEIVSARNMDKQVQLKKILKKLTPGTMIVSYDISRFSRSVRSGVNFLYDVYKKGCQYWFAYEKIHYLGTASKLVIHNSLTHAEGESDKTSDRVKFANAYLRIRGDYRGREAPFGYRIDRDPITNIRKLFPNPEEKKRIPYIRKLFKEYEKVNKRSRYFADYLNERGIKFREEKTWTYSRVAPLIEEKIDVSDMRVALNEIIPDTTPCRRTRAGKIPRAPNANTRRR